jgi:thioredoxin 1
MKTVQITGDNFDATIRQGVVLLDFWAEWCGPCRMFAPIFEAAAARHPDVVFGKVDTEAESGLAEVFRIQAIPTLVVLRDGVLLAAQPGVVPGEALDDIISQVKALDMDDIRRQLEERERPAPEEPSIVIP